MKAVRLGAGPVARAQHQRKALLLLLLLRFPSSPLKLFTGEEKDCVCVPAAEKKKKKKASRQVKLLQKPLFNTRQTP